MNKREFIKQTAVVSIAGLLVPSIFLSACRKEMLLGDIDYKGKIIIIGAGAAGLYAAYILKSKGIDFTILEASNIHGGRVGKLSGFADYDIDTGAQWLHGKNSIIGDLIKNTNTTITLDNSDLKFWFNNQLVANLPKDPFIFEATNLPDISFKDHAHQQGFDSKYDNIIEAIAGDQGASASLISAFWNNKEEENWSSGDDDFKFKETYFDLINTQIAKPVLDKVQFNTPITSIDYSGDQIILTDLSNKKYVADKIIITVPISILKLNEINFNPPLPAEKTKAFAKFGMEPGMKVFLKFSEKFFDENLYGGAICAAYVDDSIGKNTNDNILMAFIMGSQAAKLHLLGSDLAITNALITELDSIYKGKAKATFIASSVQDFTEKPYIKGAYSYSTINMGDSRKIAAQSIDKKLFFAGEAMNLNGHHQTVHGAVESGYKAVIDLLESVSK